MRVMTVFQPWAQLIADRRVRLTTKAWPIDPGLIAIHAANRVNAEKAEEFGYNPEKLAQGAIIAVIDVKECLELPHPRVRHSIFETQIMDENGVHRASMQDGRYAFKFIVVKKFRKPYGPIKGKMKVWEIADGELWDYIEPLRTSVQHASWEAGAPLGANDAGKCCGSTENILRMPATSK
jgi:hypothetical protein